MSWFIINADAVRRTALQRGLSMRDLAALSGVSKATIMRDLNGERAVTKTVYRIAKALEVDPLEIIKEG